MLRATLILCGLLILGAALAGPAAAQPNKTPIFLSATDDGSSCAIGASPDPAPIFWDRDPRKVQFFVVSEGFYWEILWKGAEASGGKPDFFPGRHTIKCNQDKSSVLGPSVGKTPDAIWPYKIVVYRCVNGDKGEELPCSPKDPIIEWDD